jgi:hypothetical protein
MSDDSRVIIEEVADITDIEVGNIIVFYHPIHPIPTAHRVSEIGTDIDGWYASTLADNSTVPTGIEPYIVREHQIMGKVRMYIDY